MPTPRTATPSRARGALCKALAAGLAALSLVGAPSPHAPVREAAAQDDVRTRARALADEGQEAFAQKDYAKAVVKFEQALALVKAPTLALALARAQAGQGKLVAAQRTLQGVVLEGTAPNAPPEFKQAVNEANLELAKVQARMPQLVLVVEGADAPEVRLDGELIATVSLGKPRPVDPGAHLVTARQAGYVELEQRVIVEERQTQRVRLELQKLEAGSTPGPKATAGPTGTPALPPPSVPPAGTSDARSSMMGAGIGLLAVGVVGLGLGGLFAGLTASKHDELAANCPNGVCDASWEGALSEYRALGTASPISFAVGGVLAGASIIVFATMPGKKKPEAALAPNVTLGLRGKGLTLTF